MSEPISRIVRTKPLSDLKPGSNKGPFRAAVIASQTREAKNGTVYLRVQFRDKTATSWATCWEGAERAAEFAPGAPVQLARMTVDSFGPKFELSDVSFLGEGEYAPQEFVPSLPSSVVEKLWKEFHSFLDSVRDEDLQRLRAKIWGDERLAAKYKWHPSAVAHHHNYLGGNLQHVVGIMRIVEAVVQSYPEIDRDLVVFGGAVHDLGKLVEYEVATTIRVTEPGKLQGHLVIGAAWIAELIAAIRADGKPFSKATEAHLVHMVLSHHGKPEWGSPKPPATPEAHLLHMADYADSQTKGFLQTMTQETPDAEGWIRYWDRRMGESRNVKTRWDEDEPAAKPKS